MTPAWLYFLSRLLSLTDSLSIGDDIRCLSYSSNSEALLLFASNLYFRSPFRFPFSIQQIVIKFFVNQKQAIFIINFFSWTLTLLQNFVSKTLLKFPFICRLISKILLIFLSFKKNCINCFIKKNFCFYRWHHVVV